MCTSACTCMCVMLLSGGLDVDHPCDGDSARRQRVRDAVGAVMEMSSAVHGIIESSPSSLKNQRIAEESPMKSSKNRRMTGAWEVFRHLKLSPKKIGVGLDELVVCRQGFSTSLRLATPIELQKRPFLYTPSSCFVSPGVILDCMRPSAQEESENVGCVLTCKVFAQFSLNPQSTF